MATSLGVSFGCLGKLGQKRGFSIQTKPGATRGSMAGKRLKSTIFRFFLRNACILVGGPYN
jgi:hypothetical protein